MEQEMDSQPMTAGIDHVGLTVPRLEETVAFFTECLGWTQFGGKPDYPAAFVTDGAGRLTLWQARTDDPVPFDRKTNIGLHHLALRVQSREALDAAFERVKNWPGVTVEFAPELSGPGPKVHCMVYVPGGVRVEFAFDPR
jgi:catechol 2,3-dioxygenase-like lactoylglutathione lyase family enzyme